MWLSSRSLLAGCFEAASCPWPPRITSTSQLLKWVLLILLLKKKKKKKTVWHHLIILLDLKRFAELGSTKEEFSLTAFGLKKKTRIQTTVVTIVAQSPVKCPTDKHEGQPTAINHFLCPVLPGPRSSWDVLCDYNFTEDQKYSAPYDKVEFTPSRIASLFRLGQLPELNSLSHFDF